MSQLKDNWKIENILRLINTKGINSLQIKQFVEKYSSYDDFVHAENHLLSVLQQKGLFGIEQDRNKSNPEEQIELCEESGVQIVTIWDEEYPVLLKEIAYPPILLFVKGKLNSANTESISIVGTRKCTQYGKLAVEKFVKCFVENGITTTSGLAMGIDTYSHLFTIENGGRTIAVIASGIDMIMPAYSQKNAEKIIESEGAIVSEYQCGVRALPAFFPQRNRIISGLSRATLIIESAKKGGSLITAKFAFEQGREVFALPGNIFAEKCKGTNMLIANNIAAPAISPEYMLEELGLSDNESQLNFKEEKKIKLSQQELKLLDKIDHEPRHIDELAISAEMEMPALLVKLLELEFKGMIKQLPGKHYVRI